MKKVITIIFLMSIGCKLQPDTKALANKMWIWSHGYRCEVGDLLIFEDGIDHVKHDTIFRDERPIAKVVSVNKVKYELIVQSLTSDSTGLYISQEEFEH